ncbi:hypothetical protein FCOIX_12879 [Fusarium coicis]|nr:hypothetical protein FCOIX_12879 [Fusarium coicis]
MSESRKSAATLSDKFGCFFQTDASKPKPKAPRSRLKVDKLAEPKTAPKPARASRTPFKAKSPVVIADSEGSADEETLEEQAVTPVKRLIRTKRAATQDLTPATKRLKSIELLVESTFDDEPAGEASPDLTTRSPAPVQRHGVACRECIDKWRTNPSWVCEMAESGKRPCFSYKANRVKCSDNPEEWHTGLSGVLSSLQTFNAWKRARAASLQVKRVAAKVERYMREERDKNKALKEALEEEKALRERLEGQVKAMQAQLNGLRAANDEDNWEDEVGDEGAEGVDVGEDQNDSAE